uniref:Vesicle transport through interaction with t-SNAREs homolog 1A n=1 Tax=Cryptocotyle lingua TaxID=66766 RepID=A0A7U0TI46_9TREM|nr:VTI1A [Cryptocotyle lingua]
MDSLFQTYEKQYGSLTSDITLNLGRIPQLKDDERSKVLRETSVLFDETRDLLEQMALEVQDMSAPLKTKCDTRLQCFKSEFDKLFTEFKKPQYAVRTRSELYKGHFDGDEESLREEVLYDSDMRARLLDNTERIARSTNRLEDGLGVALQTEEVGGHILSDLGEQREKLQRSRHRLRQADADLNKSSRILSEMTRRIIQNRVLLVGTIFLMIVIFLVAIYLATKHSSPAPAYNSISSPLSNAPLESSKDLNPKPVEPVKRNIPSLNSIQDMSGNA